MTKDVTSVGRAHTTLSQAVYEEIRRRILDRELSPGTHLVERALADELEVSRVPVREALRELVRDGLAEERGRTGLYVTELTRDDIAEILELRSVLDGLVFRRLAARLDDDGAGQVEALLARTRRAIDEGRHSDAVLLNTQFHSLLRDLAGSRNLQAVMNVLDPRMGWLLSQHEDVEEVLRQHQEIFDAVRSGDMARIDLLAANHLTSSTSMMLEINPDLT